MDSMKVWVPKEMLTQIKNRVHCQAEGCNTIFHSEANLNLHMAKTHKKTEYLNKKFCDSFKEFHCPETGCSYNDKAHFKSFKLLKQHYTKVHMEKNISCGKCGKLFSLENVKNKHEEYCGIVFKCSDCQASYECYDTLTTHARRKSHKIQPKISFKPVQLIIKHTTSGKVNTQVFILPKRTDKSIQTDCEEPKVKKLKEDGKNRNSAQTQTLDEFVVVKKIEPDAILINKNITTQTNSITSTTKSCNTSLPFDFNWIDEYVEKTTLGTQTLNELTNFLENGTQNDFEFINSSCQTSFNGALDDFDSGNFFNMETQTESIFDLLHSGIENSLNTSCTQTLVDDVLKSVASQTLVSLNQNGNTASVCRDTAHIETQTDVAFKQMLEEINA